MLHINKKNHWLKLTWRFILHHSDFLEIRRTRSWSYSRNLEHNILRNYCFFSTGNATVDCSDLCSRFNSGRYVQYTAYSLALDLIKSAFSIVLMLNYLPSSFVLSKMLWYHSTIFHPGIPEVRQNKFLSLLSLSFKLVIILTGTEGTRLHHFVFAYMMWLKLNLMLD